MTLVLSEYNPQTGIGRLTLNRPEVLNALDVAMARAFLAAVRALTARPGLRVIILSGAGRAFAAGGDVVSFTANGVEAAPTVIHELLDALNPAILALRQHPAPVIAAARGVAAGAGLSLVLTSDLIVAEEHTSFLLGYDRIGVTPDCGMSWFLPRRVGRGLAFEMMLTSRSLTAAEALAVRLIDRLASAEHFESVVTELACAVAKGPTRAFGQFKALLDGTRDLAAQLEAERQAFIAATATADFAEGVAAFAGKRAVDFRGH